VDSRIQELFARYQLGTATQAERKLVEDWFASFNQIPQQQLNPQQEAELFGPVDNNINFLLANQSRKRFIDNRWFQAAAMLFVSLAAGLVLFLLPKRNSNEVITYSYFKTPNGARKSFALPDGSIIVLNSGSSIRVPSNFGRQSREIALTGEAFFEIKHNAEKPFTIHSGKLLITDLGTAFNVKAYPEDGRVQVAVESGEVKVEKNNPNGSAVLFAGSVKGNHQFTYDKLSNHYSVNDIQPGDMLGWRQNKLRFDNASFNEIARTLERWYNIKINLNGTNSHCRLYTVAFNNEPVDKVLNVLGNLSGANYQIHNKIVTLNLPKCK
jgi:ferric-dicitrate binding protein FerR (iron transport regulator)